MSYHSRLRASGSRLAGVASNSSHLGDCGTRRSTSGGGATSSPTGVAGAVAGGVAGAPAGWSASRG
eukprot:3219199-Alexandrium_andersonii.AAC.1